MSKTAKKRKPTNREEGGHHLAPAFREHVLQTYGEALDMDDAPEALRMSDALLNLVEPYQPEMDLPLLLDCATIAWNETLNEDFQKKGSYALINPLLDFRRRRELIDALKARKRLLYKNNRRQIMEVKAYSDGENWNVNVAAELGIEDAFESMMSTLKDLCEEETQKTSKRASKDRSHKEDRAE